MQALRILHVTPYFEHAWAYGGIPRLSAALCKSLARRGHEVTVCTTDVRDARSRLAPAAPRCGPHAVSVRVFPNVSNRLAYQCQFFTPVGFDAWLRRHAGAFDVAHLHACHHVPGAIAAWRLSRARVPYVLAPNGTAPRIERRRLAKLLFDCTLGRSVLPNAAHLLAVSEAERRQLTTLGVRPERVRVIPNPVDLDEFDPPVDRGPFRARTGLAGPIVLFLGALTPRKNVDVLVRAFSPLASRATLVIAGNDMGGAAAVTRLARSLDLGASMRMTGLLEGRARLEALAAADVVVYPSSLEIFGLVPLEALLCGTPVIVANDSGCGEIVGRIGGGLEVPPRDHAALTDAIGRVLADLPLWRRAAADAAVRVRERFSSDQVTARIEALYAEVITSTVAGAPAWR
jgi:glycosyltransferase involved in cell wall biosynthesis